ncbi:MAG: hypothetical protein RL748_2896 [Pseudomonadota bacterium]|jgi:predicted porin
MKKSLLAIAALSLVAGAASAQSNVTVYGAVDIGISKAKDKTTALGRGDNNKLGFRGVEDLGGGLSAIFQLEMRYEPDTGTTEASPNRPLFQGQSRVGLKGAFGQIRMGRGLTAMQESAGAFEPWSFDSNRANLVSYAIAGYNSDPLNTGSSTNRWSNGIWYNSPEFGGGFQTNFTLASKEAVTNGTPTVNAYSFSGTYKNGPLSLMTGYERNGIETRFWNIAGTYTIASANNLKVMASYARQTPNGGATTKGLVLGLQAPVGSGVILAGYGRNTTDARSAINAAGIISAAPVGTSSIADDRQFSLGYEHNLSKRTFLYTDILSRRVPNTALGLVGGGTTNTHQIDVGIHHNF